MPRLTRPRVALFIESSLGFGRGVLRGIARHQRLHRPWSLFLEQRELGAAPPPWFARWRGDGIITRLAQRRLRRPRLPVVALDDQCPPGPQPAVLNDNRAVGRLAAEHLLSNGFQHLAFYGPPSLWWAGERLAGVQSIATPAVRLAKRGPWDAEQRALADWLAGLPRPLGLVAANDLHGMRALDACRRAGLAVPEEVAVIGADDDVELCELADPPLSSVCFNSERVGYEAAALLDLLMQGGAAPAAPLLVAPLGIAVRQSSDLAAIADPVVARALHLIRRHACSGASVGALLAELPWSRRVIEQRFVSALGRSPKAELRRVQIAQAQRLLTDSELTGAAIASAIGLRQAAWFCAVFRAATGLTPAAWRRQARPQPRRR